MLTLTLNWHILVTGLGLGLIPFGLALLLMGIFGNKMEIGALIFPVYLFPVGALIWIGSIVYSFLQPHITWH